MISRTDAQVVAESVIAGWLPDEALRAGLAARLVQAIYDPTCTLDDCDNPSRSRRGGLCVKHHTRQARRGSVEDTAASHLTLEERFWLNVTPTTRDACWEYAGPKHAHGYGLISARYAHRVSYELHYGPFPRSMHVRHTCDNPPCVNPAHLELGTHADNMRDMAERGRARAGYANAARKLTPERVRAMRFDAATGLAVPALAERYDVDRKTVRMAINRESWKDV